MIIDVTSKVSMKDKDRLMELISEAKQILDRYDYTKSSHNCVRDRAKSSIFDAYEWCSYLEVYDDVK